MNITVLAGRANQNKSKWILDRIQERLKEDPQGPAIFYLVPEQMTFQQEYALFNSSTLRGSIRAQVVSFSRLAWRILQETGGGSKTFISSIGIQMILRKIVEDRIGEWKVFGQSIDKQGFLEELENMIHEFKRHLITPDILNMFVQELDQFVHKSPREKTLLHKLEDLIYIYEQLNEHLQAKYMDGEDYLQLLMDHIHESDLLKNAEVYIDGFYSFTPQELRVIEELSKKCKQLTIALTVNVLDDQPEEMDLFYPTKKTYAQLKEIVALNDGNITHIYLSDEQYNRFKNKPFFRHLEKYFDERPVPSFEGEVPIQICEAIHPRAEIEGIAQTILSSVREKNYRFRDIALIVRDIEGYYDLIQTIFTDYEIPVFIDEKKPMYHHPFIEFVRSSLDLVTNNWRYEDMFRLLKTGFIPSTDEKYPLSIEAIDELENYVLEYGIRSKSQWMNHEWKYIRYYGFEQAIQTDKEKEKEKRLRAYRDQIVEALLTFDEEVRRAETVEQFCYCIFRYLEKLDVPNQLEQLREKYEQTGAIEKSKEQEQVWDAMIQLMDEMVELIGDQEVSLQTYQKMIEAGFETLKFSHVPPSLDHVIVGTVDHSRFTGIKCAFLVGVNEGFWPLATGKEGMIDDEERELLSERGITLAESNQRNLFDDWFHMYKAFTIATDELWISYLLSDENGDPKAPSQLIKRIIDLFPACSEKTLLSDPDDEGETERFITTPGKTRAALTHYLARSKRGYPIDQIWYYVLNWYVQHHNKYGTTHKILQSLFYKNEPTDLEKETVQKLYPKQIRTSVSRLESYYRCSYQHFVQYSLNLQERPMFQLKAPDIGQLFHEALKLITEWVQSEEKDFKVVNEARANQYAKRALHHLAPVLQHRILSSSNRYKYIQRKLEEIIGRATFVLSEQARRSGFSPIGIEVGFGLDKDSLQPVKIPLPNGYELLLRGRIDRVDQAYKGEQLYLRIIDYKSSAQQLSLLDLYYGLSLQMLAYLDVILSQSEEWLGIQAQPAGVLYFHVHDAMISAQDRLKESELERELLKSYKMDGFLLQEEEVARLMDETLDTGYSDIVPIALRKDGGFYKQSKVLSQDTFSALKNYIRHLIIQAGLEMTAGEIYLNPFEKQGISACTYCPFLSVCQFDPSLGHNQYRRLQSMKEEELLKAIQKKGGKIDEMDE